VELGPALAGLGSLSLAGALVMALYRALTNGKLIPKTIHDQRMADKQELVDFYRETATKATAANDSQSGNVAKMISDLRAITVAVSSHNGGERP
jgi:hypothetical protein